MNNISIFPLSHPVLAEIGHAIFRSYAESRETSWSYKAHVASCAAVRRVWNAWNDPDIPQPLIPAISHAICCPCHVKQAQILVWFVVESSAVCLSIAPIPSIIDVQHSQAVWSVILSVHVKINLVSGNWGAGNRRRRWKRRGRRRLELCKPQRVH